MDDVILVPDSDRPQLEDEPWWVHSLCGSLNDPDLFFDRSRKKEAKALCARCPVRRPCAAANASAEAATGRMHWYGIVAGETANARRAHARQAR